MHPDFWQGKRVLLTGHTGFKGSWLSLWFKKLGAEVIGYALEPATTPSLFGVTKVADGIHSVIGDVRDRENLIKCMKAAKPDIVIHMAAQALVRYSYHNPVETYEVNVMGTVNLLEAVRASDSVRSVLVITSDKCYENRERNEGYREDEAMGGFDPYSSSKGCTELVVSAYRQSFFESGKKVAVATARAGNVIGGGDWSDDRLIPDMARSFSRGETVTIRHPFAIRPWQHVFEALHGYLLLLEKMWDQPLSFSEAWNFGPDESDAKTVSWIVEYFANLWGEADWFVKEDIQQLHEAAILRLDSTKAREKLGWVPSLDLGAALKGIVLWYRCHYESGDIISLSNHQLDEFQQLVTS